MRHEPFTREHFEHVLQDLSERVARGPRTDKRADESEEEYLRRVALWTIYTKRLLYLAEIKCRGMRRGNI